MPETKQTLKILPKHFIFHPSCQILWNLLPLVLTHNISFCTFETLNYNKNGWFDYFFVDSIQRNINLISAHWQFSIIKDCNGRSFQTVKLFWSSKEWYFKVRLAHFCLRPKANNLGLTWVVVLVGFSFDVCFINSNHCAIP